MLSSILLLEYRLKNGEEMSNVPDNLKYTKDHEWLSIEGDIATVGITDYAQESLGDLVFVELPKVGAKFESGKDMVIVESCKAASDVYAPVAGEVVAVNDNVTNTPDTINSDPYANGWLVKMKIDPAAVANLLDAEAYKKLLD
jgi:glycine cleavage system H protein